MAAIRKWVSAAEASFGKEDIVRSCAKWLALSCNTMGGSLHSLSDVEAACRDIGIAAAETHGVAVELWAGLSIVEAEQTKLPASLLLDVLTHPEEPQKASSPVPPETPRAASAPEQQEDAASPRLVTHAPAEDEGQENLHSLARRLSGGADARWRARCLNPEQRKPIMPHPPPEEKVGARPPSRRHIAAKAKAKQRGQGKGEHLRKDSRRDVTDRTPERADGRDRTQSGDGATALAPPLERTVTPKSPRRHRHQATPESNVPEDDQSATASTVQNEGYSFTGSRGGLSRRHHLSRSLLSPESILTALEPQGSRAPSRAPSLAAPPGRARSRHTSRVVEVQEESPKAGVDDEVKALFHNLFQVTHDKVVEQETQEKEFMTDAPTTPNSAQRFEVATRGRRTRAGADPSSRRGTIFALTPEPLGRRRSARASTVAGASPLTPPTLERGVSRIKKRRGTVDHSYDMLTRAKPSPGRRNSLIPGLRARLEKEKQMQRARSEEWDFRREGSFMGRSLSKSSASRSGSKQSPRALLSEAMARTPSTPPMGAQDSLAGAKKESARADLARRMEKAKLQSQAAQETKLLQARLQRERTADLMTTEQRQDLAAISIQKLVRGSLARGTVQEFFFEGVWTDPENAPGWRFQVVVLPSELKKTQGFSKVKFTVLEAPLDMMEFLDESLLLFLRGRWHSDMNCFIGEGLYAEHRFLEDVLQLADSTFTLAFRNIGCTCTDHCGYSFDLKAQPPHRTAMEAKAWDGYQRKVGCAASLLQVSLKQRREVQEAPRFRRGLTILSMSSQLGAVLAAAAEPEHNEATVPDAPLVSAPLGADAHPEKDTPGNDVDSAAQISQGIAENNDCEEDVVSVKTLNLQPVADDTNGDALPQEASPHTDDRDSPTRSPLGTGSPQTNQGYRQSNLGSPQEASPVFAPEAVTAPQEWASLLPVASRVVNSMASAASGSSSGLSSEAVSTCTDEAARKPEEAGSGTGKPVSDAVPLDQMPVIVASTTPGGSPRGGGQANSDSALDEVTGAESMLPPLHQAIKVDSGHEEAEAAPAAPAAEVELAKLPAAAERNKDVQVSGQAPPESPKPDTEHQQQQEEQKEHEEPVEEQIRKAPADAAQLSLPRLPPTGSSATAAPVTAAAAAAPAEVTGCISMETLLAVSARSSSRHMPATNNTPRNPSDQEQHSDQRQAPAAVPPLAVDSIPGERVSMDVLLQAVRSARQAASSGGSNNEGSTAAPQVRSASAMASSLENSSTYGSMSASTQRSKGDWPWMGPAGPLRHGSALLSAARGFFRPREVSAQ